MRSLSFLFVGLLLTASLGMTRRVPDCGPYPWEFSHTFCPMGSAIFVCTTVDGLEHWVFVGCWEF